VEGRTLKQGETELTDQARLDGKSSTPWANPGILIGLPLLPPTFRRHECNTNHRP
jgi:hypothetical protein